MAERRLSYRPEPGYGGECRSGQYDGDLHTTRGRSMAPDVRMRVAVAFVEAAGFVPAFEAVDAMTRTARIRVGG
jgi:hypothetical protein